MHRCAGTATALAAKGFGSDSTNDLKNYRAGGEGNVFAGKMLEDYREERLKRVREEVQWPKPKYELPGPLKPPPAPATYKALTKIRLRVAPSGLADLASLEIEAGAFFRVLEAKEDTVVLVEGQPPLMFLRTDSEYGHGWLVEKGIAGKWAGKKVIQRVAGSAKKAKVAVLQLSEVEEAEMVEGSSATSPAATAAVEADQIQKETVSNVLQDPKLLELCEQIGIDPNMLKSNPEFMRRVTRRLYGEEVTS